jgi:hypothetical protein
VSETLESMLGIYLADLHAHVEEQLRRVSDLQRLTRTLATSCSPDRSRRFGDVARELFEFDRANAAMHQVTSTAMDAARSLQGATREE